MQGNGQIWVAVMAAASPGQEADRVGPRRKQRQARQGCQGFERGNHLRAPEKREWWAAAAMRKAQAVPALRLCCPRHGAQRAAPAAGAPHAAHPGPALHRLTRVLFASAARLACREGRRKDTASPASVVREGTCRKLMWPGLCPRVATYTRSPKPMASKSCTGSSSRRSRAAGTCGGRGEQGEWLPRRTAFSGTGHIERRVAGWQEACRAAGTGQGPHKRAL